MKHDLLWLPYEYSSPESTTQAEPCAAITNLQGYVEIIWKNYSERVETPAYDKHCSYVPFCFNPSIFRI